MSRVLVIGCGGVASVAIHKICQVSEVFSELCIASRMSLMRKLVIQENSDAVFRIGFLQGVSVNLYNSSTDRASFITSSVSIFSKKSLTLVFIIPLR